MPRGKFASAKRSMLYFESLSVFFFERYSCLIVLQSKSGYKPGSCDWHYCNVSFVNSNSSICSGGSRPSDKGAPRHPDPDIRWWGGGPGLERKIFQPFGPSVWSKNKGGRAPLDPPLVCDGVCIYHITVAPSFFTTICGL